MITLSTLQYPTRSCFLKESLIDKTGLSKTTYTSKVQYELFGEVEFRDYYDNKTCKRVNGFFTISNFKHLNKYVCCLGALILETNIFCLKSMRVFHTLQ